MTLDQLQYFVTSAEFQHIGKAARTLNISPSAISHAIRNLEESLGVVLFEKSGKNIFLTETGKKFAVRARELLKDVSQLKHEFVSADLPLEGVVRLAATHGLSDHFIAPALGNIQAAHPKLTFDLCSARSAEVIQMAAMRTIDVGICFSPLPHPEVTVHRQVRTKLKIAVRRTHPVLKKRRADRLACLGPLPTASPKSYAGVEICEDHPALKTTGLSPEVRLAFDSYSVAAGFLRKSDAWGLIPDILIAPLDLVSVEGIDFDADASVAIVTPKERPISPVLLEVLGAAVVSIARAK